MRHHRLSTFLLLLLTCNLTAEATARTLQQTVSKVSPSSGSNASAPVQSTPAPAVQESSNSTRPAQQAAQQAENSVPSTTQSASPSPNPAVDSNSRDGKATAPPSRTATPLSSPKPTIVQGSSSDFAGAPSNQFVKPGDTLTYQGAQLSRLADVFSYSYKASQPYINQAVGYVLWPSIVLAPNASVSLTDVTASYVNPSVLDSCEEYTFKQQGGLQASLGDAAVSGVNGTAVRVGAAGPVSETVLVQDGEKLTNVGEATATFSNVVLVCLPNPNSEAGLGPSAGPGSGPGPVSGPGSGPGPNLSSPGSGPAGSNSSETRSTPSGRASEIVPAPNPSGSESSPSGPGFNFSGPASNPSGPASESGPGSNSGGPGSSPSPRP